MLERTNKEIIDDIFIRCSDKLDKQLYIFDNILGERETLALIDDGLYFYVAGNVLMLRADGTDTSNSPELVVEENMEYYMEERKVILQYLLTLIHYEMGDSREEAMQKCINMLETTTRTFSREFLNVLYLIVLFDGDSLFRNLTKPLADYCANILYNEFQKQEAKQPQKNK